MTDHAFGFSLSAPRDGAGHIVARLWRDFRGGGVYLLPTHLGNAPLWRGAEPGPRRQGRSGARVSFRRLFVCPPHEATVLVFGMAGSGHDGVPPRRAGGQRERPWAGGRTGWSRGARTPSRRWP